MILKRFLLLIGILIFWSSIHSQIFTEDFESGNGGYTTTSPECNSGSDYFTLTNDAGIPATFTGSTGNYFAAQDIDGCVSVTESISWSGINIAGCTGLSFSIDFAEDDDGSNEDWDDDEYVRIFYSIDGGAEQNLIWIHNDGSTFNSAPFIDTDFNGIGDGAEITDAFTTFTQAIASTGSSMDIRIEISLNQGDEDIAFDNLELTGSCTSNTINTSNVLTAPFNVDCSAGDGGTVDYSSVGTFNAGNIFTAQLSDASGSFAAPINIGNESNDGVDPSGQIIITIPAGIASGTGYRIRVISDNPNTVGSDNGVDFEIINTPCTITVTSLSSLSYTVDCSSGQTGTLNFTTDGTFNGGNVFTAELSDASGSFVSPTSIGTLTASGTDPSGTINFTIPAGTPSGTGYRIRVVSSDPNITGSDNGSDITINLSGGPCVLEPPHATSMIINSCNTSCGEGNNEVIFGNTGDYSVLINSANFELTYGSSPSPTNDYTDPLVTNPTTTSALNDSSNCPGLFVDGTNTTIPPNSTIMLAHDAICPGDVLDFSNLCGTGPIYIIYTQDVSWSLGGNFVNSTGSGIRYMTTTITATDGSTHVIDYSFDSALNTGTDGDYAKWNSNGGMAIEQGNNGCALDPVVLPVELVRLQLSLDLGNSVTLDWVTSSEVNNNSFTIYHSQDGKSFKAIETIQGAGNSSSKISYSSMHRSPVDGINYYLLRSTDFDGTSYVKSIEAINVHKSIVYYDYNSEILHLPKVGDYKVLSIEGRIVNTVFRSDVLPFHQSGIFIIQNLDTGRSYKISIQ